MVNSPQVTPYHNEERCFLLKLDPTGCPNGIGTPSIASDWEGKEFVSSMPRAIKDGVKLPPEQTNPPVPGDHLLVWVNLEVGGTGLTATARISTCRTDGRSLRIRVSSVVLFPEPRLNDIHLRRTARNSGTALDDILRNRRSNLRFLSPAYSRELSLIGQSRSAFSRGIEPSSWTTTIPEEEERRQAERERTWKLIEQRQNQGIFREILIQRDNGRCAVTGCCVLSVIEAAHLIPYATGDPNRDAPENGILLRADIHTLFDRGFMAIAPITREVWIAEELANTEYRAFCVPGRHSVTGAGEPNLRYHFDWSMRVTPTS